mmetsp:Transcript_66858/g.184383  ORF Transcript_66858/g.184383 Transcript_66858/m.184383 type:complete len:245 (-) Transcript_66858:3025-3759(-)
MVAAERLRSDIDVGPLAPRTPATVGLAPPLYEVAVNGQPVVRRRIPAQLQEFGSLPRGAHERRGHSDHPRRRRGGGGARLHLDRLRAGAAVARLAADTAGVARAGRERPGVELVGGGHAADLLEIVQRNRHLLCDLASDADQRALRHLEYVVKRHRRRAMGSRERSSAADQESSTLDWLSSVQVASGGIGDRNVTTSSEYTHEWPCSSLATRASKHTAGSGRRDSGSLRASASAQRSTVLSAPV